MCDNCKAILGSCVRSHLEKDCHLKKSSYCSICSCYGHTYTNCTRSTCTVEYLEQLVPSNLLEENNILTNTPIVKGIVGSYNNTNPIYIEDLIPENYIKMYSIGSKTPIHITCRPMKATIDVIDNPKAIRDLLKAYGQMPKKDNRNKDKYKIYLEKFAKKNNYNIVYHLYKKDDSNLEYEYI